ncbi:CoA ester lyase (plasmid) [Salipiger sp. H15]|uniref:CoA ester lyase n=1 Tax=Alloyangia sp. H15 TaxID=3029062 RepID=A0AAU8AQB1_9RHOB
MRQARSYLFVPGERPARFAKAAASGADAIVLDLEDAVGPGSKDAARAQVCDWLAAGGPGIVRINGADTPWLAQDLAALEAFPHVAVMVPKAEPEAVAHVAALLPGRPLLALVETVAGLAHLRETACHPAVTRLAFGNLDFGADARIPGVAEVLDPARFEIALASRLGGLPQPIEGVTVELSDPEALRDDIRRARLRGFGAKLCIHPSQVAPVNEGFAPTAGEIDWARRILAALAAAAGSVVQVDGKMVDRPLIDRARQILGDAEPAPA